MRTADAGGCHESCEQVVDACLAIDKDIGAILSILLLVGLDETVVGCLHGKTFLSIVEMTGIVRCHIGPQDLPAYERLE